MELEKTRFVVTGSTRGIGRALAEMLVRARARVCVNGRKETEVRDLVALLRGQGADVAGVAGDVGSDADARRIVGAAERAFDGIDVLVNNAAILTPRARVVDTRAETWAEVLRVNVIGAANLIRHVLPAMERRGSGVIVNLSSGWGRAAEGWVAPYCASKFAVEALTQSVADESRCGVIVFALNPGIIRTEMLATAFDEDVSRYPAPGDLDRRWASLFARVEPGWHGTSRDLFQG